MHWLYLINGHIAYTLVVSNIIATVILNLKKLLIRFLPDEFALKINFLCYSTYSKTSSMLFWLPKVTIRDILIFIKL